MPNNNLQLIWGLWQLCVLYFAALVNLLQIFSRESRLSDYKIPPRRHLLLFILFLLPDVAIESQSQVQINHLTIKAPDKSSSSC